jgi:hypothetical protein
MPDEASEKSSRDAEVSDDVSAANAASETRTTDAPAADASAPNPVKRKRKRKKPAVEEPSEPAPPALTPDGRERPLFVLGYPKDPELDRLVRAFEVGNYAYVREHALELAEHASSQRVRDAARELARRIEPDPLIKVLLALSITLLVVLAAWAYKTHGQ